jgi:hypothetical protein
MKRSSNIALVAMGTASFVASFVAGNAVLNWMGPSTTNQVCTTLADGTKSCRNTTPRASSFTYYITRPFYYGTSEDRSAPKAAFANTGATTKTAVSATTTRGGFGTIASAASAHASAGS